MQGRKARAPGFGSRGVGPPRADPRQIDSDSRDDVLQARLGQADVAALPQVAPADRLTVGSLDAGPSGIVQAERRGALPFAGGLQCLLIVLCLQPDDARLALGFGAARPERTWCAVPAGESGLEHHAVLRISVWQPRDALLAGRAGHHLPVPLDDELRLVDAVLRAGLPTGVVGDRADNRDAVLARTVDQYPGVRVAL